MATTITPSAIERLVKHTTAAQGVPERLSDANAIVLVGRQLRRGVDEEREATAT